jgi:exopolyphosphatase/guanosine-5'-triphosphate,3'-diphosphate pyrophosphatase
MRNTVNQEGSTQPMRIGIIDLGTNSVRFDVFEEAPVLHRKLPSRKRGRALESSKIRRIYRDKLMVRLGEGLFESGRIQAAAAQRTLLAFQHFAKTAESLGLDRLIALGTSALRDGNGSAGLIRKIKKETGIQIRVISGEEEARLIAVGILGNDTLPSTAPLALIDIGGGSMEVSLVQGQKIRFSQSFPLGTARLSQLHLDQSPPTKAAVHALREEVAAQLANALPSDFSPRLAIGSSGTIRALGKLLGSPSNKRKVFKLKALERFNKKVQSLELPEIRQIPKMEANRADMILAGSLLLEETLRILGVEQIRVSEFSLRNGVLLEELNELKAHRSRLTHSEQDPEGALIELASHFGISTSRAEITLRWATALFRGLAKIHGLSSEDEKVLCQAALLREIGNSVSLIDSGKHAEYILTHLDLQSLIQKGVLPSRNTQQHLRLLAKLCSWHPRQHKVQPNELKSLRLDELQQTRFLKILALLRVIDAFDLPEDLAMLQPEFRVEVSAKKVLLHFKSPRLLKGLENLRLQQRTDLFDQIFGLSLHAVCISVRNDGSVP